MTDPRQRPDWKQQRYEQKVLLLLGAILDALKPKPEPEKPRRGRPSA